MIQLQLFIQNGILHSFRFLLFGTVRKRIKKKTLSILILRNGSLGDSICALPAIYNIRQNFPHADITILYNNGGSKLASIEGLIDQTLVNNFINYFGKSRSELINLFKKQKYDLFIELPQAHQPFTSHLRNMMFAKFIVRAHSAFGWHRYHSRLLPQQQAKQREIPNVREGFMRTLERNGLTIFEKDQYPLAITSDIQSRITDLIAKHVPGYSKQTTVGMVPGAKRPQNRWPIQNFQKVAGFLLKQGFQIVVIGGNEDKELGQELSDLPDQDNSSESGFSFTGSITNFAGQLTPLESAELLSRCQLLITNDTGPMHLAYAVGTYSISIFSSRDYSNLWYPPKEQSIVFRNNNIFCSECFTETCDDNICMQALKPEMIIREAQKQLKIGDDE